jgi:hypothetical protein
MGKGARKFTGFLWAMIIAIVSFFIIFIFFPDVSNKFFGVSIKPEKVAEVVDTTVETVKDTVTEKVTDAVTNSLGGNK